MNTKIMGDALPSEIISICKHIVTQLEEKKLTMNNNILTGLSRSNHTILLCRALEICWSFPSNSFARRLANLFTSKPPAHESIIFEFVKKIAVNLSFTFLFLMHLNTRIQKVCAIKESIMSGALENPTRDLNSPKTEELLKISLKSGNSHSRDFGIQLRLK